MQKFRLVTCLAVLVAMLAACGSTAPATPAATTAGATAAAASTAGATAAPAALRDVVMAMPYIPSVQFAHFYTADKKGYFAQEGIKVSFDYNYETDVVQRIAQGTVQFGLASGDSVLLARAQGLPVVTVATNSQSFPVVVFSKADQNITTPADLKGKTVGLPGRFGANYIGLLALLYANNLKESDLNIQEIGFTQVAAVSENKVQAALGYGNNEPLQLEQQGQKVNVIRVADSFPLASDGLITSESMVSGQADLTRSFTRALLRGMQDVIANPDEAFNTALEYIPEAQRGDQSLQKQVLQATITYWQSDATKANGLGFTSADNWTQTAKFLSDSGLLKTPVDVSKAFTNDFIK